MNCGRERYFFISLYLLAQIVLNCLYYVIRDVLISTVFCWSYKRSCVYSVCYCWLGSGDDSHIDAYVHR